MCLLLVANGTFVPYIHITFNFRHEVYGNFCVFFEEFGLSEKHLVYVNEQGIRYRRRRLQK